MTEVQNTGVGSLSLLQGIFLTQESNQGLCIAAQRKLRTSSLAGTLFKKVTAHQSAVSSVGSSVMNLREKKGIPALMVFGVGVGVLVCQDCCAKAHR